MLLNIPDIQDKNTSNINKMQYILHRWQSLLSLPDISKLNTSNVVQMNDFFECNKATKLPDISKWNTQKVEI